jgi:type I restriction enzyme S subunit
MVPSGWRVCTVDEIKAEAPYSIAIGPFGSRMKSDRYTASGVPVIRGTNISHAREIVGEPVFVSDETANELRSSTAVAGDLVFPHRGAIGEVGLVPSTGHPRWMLSTSLMKLTCDSTLADPLFVYYFFRSPSGRQELLRHASTVGTPGIGQPLTSLRSIRIRLPPLSEQRAIAATLGALDDKIELNRRINETLEAIARTIFRAWFVDFDPVRAKAEGREPWGMDAATAALFPDSFVESELGPVPAGWEMRTLSAFASLNPESWSKNTRPDTIEYVDLSNTKWGRIEATVMYARDDAPSRAQRVLRSGDTIVGTVRPGNGSYAFIAQGGLTGSTGFAVLRPNLPEHREFVYIAATTTDNIAALAHLADGAAYPAVRPDVVAEMPIVAPTDPVVTRFSETANPLLIKVALNERESRILTKLRDTLLPGLVSGGVRVPLASGGLRVSSGKGPI